MKISMHMLCYWLREYTPVTTITEGKRTITNARLFTEDAETQRDCVYVGRMNDFFPYHSSEEILLMHRGDVISLHSSDLNLIFNIVLSAFDFYNQMELNMMRGIMKAHPEQAILDECAQLLGAAFIITPDYRILAITDSSNDGYVNSHWERMKQDREIAVDMLPGNEKNVLHKMLKRQTSGKTFIEPSAAPYHHGYVMKYTDFDGQFLGLLVVANVQPSTLFEIDIAEIIIEMLEHAQAQKHTQSQAQETVLQDLASGHGGVFFQNLLLNRETERSAKYLKLICEENEDTQYTVVLIDASDGTFLPTVMRGIYKNIRHSLVVRNGNALSVLLWGNSKCLNEARLALVEMMQDVSLTCGVSNPFQELAFCVDYYRQAQIAARQHGDGLVLYRNIALSHILQEADMEFRRKCLHPGVFTLAAFDTAENSALLLTLKNYLFTGRSLAKTATRMYLHKNTITYRIGQVKDLGIMDLEDDHDREYMLLSLLLYTEQW